MPRKIFFNSKKIQRPTPPASACNSKVRYAHRHTAEAAIADAQILRPGAKLRAYQCPYCHGWHLTSQANT